VPLPSDGVAPRSLPLGVDDGSSAEPDDELPDDEVPDDVGDRAIARGDVVHDELADQTDVIAREGEP